MKLANAIKALEKAGFTIENNGPFYYAKKTGLRHFVEFISNGDGDKVATVSVKPHHDRDDVMSDYSSGVWVDNISQAIRLAH